MEQVWREAIQVEQVWTNGGGDGYEVWWNNVVECHDHLLMHKINSACAA